MSAIGVGIAGAGLAGKQFIGAITENSRLRLRHVVKGSPGGEEHLRRLAGDTELRVSQDFADLTRAPDIDLIVIASPNGEHAEQILLGTQAGKHLLVEKPIVTTASDCRRVVDAVEAAGVVLLCGQICRFSPFFRKAREYVENGCLGDCQYVYGSYVHRVLNPTKPWWRDASAPASFAALGAGSHPVDLMRWCAGEVAAVTGVTVKDNQMGEYGFVDTVDAQLLFRSGCPGHLLVALSAVRPYSIDLFLHGSRLSVEAQRGEVHVSDGGAFQRVPVEYHPEHPYFGAELAHIVECIDGGAAPLCGVRDAANTVMTCLAVVEAARTGTTVDVAHV
jgi:predicted dehydrogenase